MFLIMVCEMNNKRKSNKNIRKKFEAGGIALLILISISLITSECTMGINIKSKIKDKSNPPYFPLYNDPLVPDANGPYEAIVDEPIQFHGSASGGIPPYVNWTWDFGDGNISYEKDPLHNYSSVNVFKIYLKVTDSIGMSGWAKTTANIIEPPKCTLRITISTYWTWREGENVIFNIKVSNNKGGDKASYYFKIWIQPINEWIDNQSGIIEGSKVNSHTSSWLNAKAGTYIAYALLYYKNNNKEVEKIDTCTFRVKRFPGEDSFFNSIFGQNKLSQYSIFQNPLNNICSFNN